MLKIVPVGSWPELSADGIFVRPLPVLRSGRLGSTDAKQFLKSSQATPEFLRKFAEIELQPGDIPLHMIALGATEAWGPNRNADGFTESTCKACHHGFVKLARFYLRHQNKDPAKSYGIVKLSHYNEPMRRVELLILANGNEEAARRHKGLVLPEKIAQSILAGEDRAGSMSCTLEADKCINCEKRARSRREYCTEEECINPRTGRQGFGCRYGLGKAAEDGFLQYVDNPPPLNWFDISDVTPNPADPTAYGVLVPEELFAGRRGSKAAAWERGPVIGGAELGERVARWSGQFFPEEPVPRCLKWGWDLSGAGRELLAQRRWAERLAQQLARPEYEKWAEIYGNPFSADYFACTPVDWRSVLTAPGSDVAKARLRKLARQKIGLSLADLACWLGISTEYCKSAARLLWEPEAWLNLSESWRTLERNPFWDSTLSGGTEISLSPTAGWERSLEKQAVLARAGCALVCPEDRLAAVELREHPETVRLAGQYGLYKLAQLAMTHDGREFDLPPDEERRLLLLTVLQLRSEAHKLPI